MRNGELVHGDGPVVLGERALKLGEGDPRLHLRRPPSDPLLVEGPAAADLPELRLKRYVPAEDLGPRAQAEGAAKHLAHGVKVFAPYLREGAEDAA